MEGYSRENLNCPFIAIETPEFDAGGVWSAEQIADFALSWSAHLRAKEDGIRDRSPSRGLGDVYKRQN